MKTLKPWRDASVSRLADQNVDRIVLLRDKTASLFVTFCGPRYALSAAKGARARGVNATIFKMAVWPRFKEKKHGNNS